MEWGWGSSHPLGDGGDEMGMESWVGDKDEDGKFSLRSSFLQPCLQLNDHDHFWVKLKMNKMTQKFISKAGILKCFLIWFPAF